MVFSSAITLSMVCCTALTLGLGLGDQLFGRIDSPNGEVVAEVLLQILQVGQPGVELVAGRFHEGLDAVEGGLELGLALLGQLADLRVVHRRHFLLPVLEIGLAPGLHVLGAFLGFLGGVVDARHGFLEILVSLARIGGGGRDDFVQGRHGGIDLLLDIHDLVAELGDARAGLVGLLVAGRGRGSGAEKLDCRDSQGGPGKDRSGLDVFHSVYCLYLFGVLHLAASLVLTAIEVQLPRE